MSTFWNISVLFLKSRSWRMLRMMRPKSMFLNGKVPNSENWTNYNPVFQTEFGKELLASLFLGCWLRKALVSKAPRIVSWRYRNFWSPPIHSTPFQNVIPPLCFHLMLPLFTKFLFHSFFKVFGGIISLFSYF